MSNLDQIIAFIQAALEASVYLEPNDPGLSEGELVEIGKQAGYERGELSDALVRSKVPRYFGARKLLPEPSMVLGQFHFPYEPDYRSIEAFDFVIEQLRAVVREQGVQRGQLERSVLVERAVAKNLPRKDAEVAIAVLVISAYFTEKDGLLRFALGRESYALPSEQQANAGGGPLRQRPALAKAYPIVKDVISRRSDGRPSQSNALDAFGDELQKLSYGRFRLWWTQMVAELRRSDAQLLPVTVCVLSAALVEGALAFVVKHAKSCKLGVFGSTTFDDSPTRWKIDDLVASAARGGDAAILDADAKTRADMLIRTRQRIHAGRMLAEFATGAPPDLRPEEANDARATAELVVRRVLDWLTKYPPTAE